MGPGRKPEPGLGLSLSEVASLLDVSPRRVQYLRETGAVVPSVVGQGRGNFCAYSGRDTVLVYLALVVLDGLSTEVRDSVLAGVEWPVTERIFTVPMGPHVELRVDLGSILDNLLQKRRSWQTTDNPSR